MLRAEIRRFLTPAGLLVALTVAACADSPVGVDGGTAAAREGLTAEISSGSGQTGVPGAVLASEPAVRVRTQSGRPASGVLVRFTVVQGGGLVERAEALTNEYGVATAGKWQLGAEPGANVVEAQVSVLPAVRFTAQAVAPPPPPAPVSAFQIVTRYIGSATTRQKQAVSAAVARWQGVILADLPNVPMSVPAGSCFEKQPALNETVDDLLIFIEFADIDGPGKVLGSAGPCYIRTESGLPILGYLKLDTSDLQLMENAGTLDDVVLHEIGHVLGIGTLWSHRSLLTGAGGTDPVFHGAGALGEYRTLGGTATGVPVENTGEEGTRDGHWRETVFGNELMTGYISGTTNPLSAMTIASLKDLGYGASTSTASTYTLGGSPGRVTAGIDLHGREKMLKPKYRVDRSGKKERLPEH